MEPWVEYLEEGYIAIFIYDSQRMLLENPVDEFLDIGSYQFVFDRTGHEWIWNSYTLIGL